eukprot:6482687-Amphidinium_carterae.1
MAPKKFGKGLPNINPPWLLSEPGDGFGKAKGKGSTKGCLGVLAGTSHTSGASLPTAGVGGGVLAPSTRVGASLRVRSRSPPRVPRTPVCPERKDSPILNLRVRGSVSQALRVAADPELLAQAVSDFERDKFASSSRGPNDS